MVVKVEKIGDVDLEALKKKGNLSPDDEASIAAAALKEIQEIEKRKKETPEETKAREIVEKDTTEKEERADLDSRAKELGLEPGTTKEEVEKKEIESGKRTESPEEKTVREKKEADSKIEKDKVEVKDKEKVAADLIKEAETYAAEAKIPIEDARKELESIYKVVEKYGNDPKKLSKAFLTQQRENTKAQEKITELSKPPEIKPSALPLESLIKHIEDGKLTVNGKAQPKEAVIEAFKEKHPKLTGTADEETVLGMVAKEIQALFIKQDELDLQNLSKTAGSKREELLNNLPEEDKEFIPLLQPVLSRTPDFTVVEDEYRLDDLVSWARGKNSKQREKDAYERGLKKGTEGAKIVAIKPPEGEPPLDRDEGKEKISKLSDADKARAKEMYDGTTMTDDQKFLAYIEYMEKNPKK